MAEKKGEKKEEKSQEVDFWAEKKNNPAYIEFVPFTFTKKKTILKDRIVLVFGDYYSIPWIGISLDAEQIRGLIQVLNDILKEMGEEQKNI
jgi:hypothetical protein